MLWSIVKPDFWCRCFHAKALCTWYLHGYALAWTNPVYFGWQSLPAKICLVFFRVEFWISDALQHFVWCMVATLESRREQSAQDIPQTICWGQMLQFIFSIMNWNISSCWVNTTSILAMLPCNSSTDQEQRKAGWVLFTDRPKIVFDEAKVLASLLIHGLNWSVTNSSMAFDI